MIAHVERVANHLRISEVAAELLLGDPAIRFRDKVAAQRLGKRGAHPLRFGIVHPLTVTGGVTDRNKWGFFGKAQFELVNRWKEREQ